MNNTDGSNVQVEFSKAEDSRFEARENVPLNESLHKTEKLCWELLYPIWKSKSFRYFILISVLLRAILNRGEVFFKCTYSHCFISGKILK